jgi:hypothetical protein
MINPGEIPQIPGDIEAVARHGGALQTAGKSFGSTGSDVHSTWQGLSAFYSAPEAAELFAATGPVKQKAEAVGSDIAAVGTALVAYADEVRPIKARLASLQAEAQTFVGSVAGDDDWRKDGDKVNHNNQLLSDVNGQLSAWMAAQRTCANAIDRLFGGTQYVEDNGDGTRDQNEYGYSAELLNHAAAGEDGVPWGRPDERDKPWYQDVGDTLVSFGKGVVVDGLWGTVKGLGNLAGFGGWDALKQSWGGLLKLGLALSPPLLIANQFTALPGLPRGTLANTLTETGKALLAWDQWRHDPARAAGNVVFNVASVVFGTKGAGATTKGLSTAAKGTRAAELAARTSLKVSEVVAILKSKLPTLKLPDFLAPKTIAYALDEDFVKTQQLVNEVKAAGLKIDEDSVLQIGRDPNGKIVWLEEGGINPRTGNEVGLRHIVNQHGDEFEKAGIPRGEVGEFVHRAVTEGKYTGYYQGSHAPGRPIFELEYNGTTHYVAVQIGDNGYVVGADLRSATNPFHRAGLDPRGIGDPTYRGW